LTIVLMSVFINSINDLVASALTSRLFHNLKNKSASSLPNNRGALTGPQPDCTAVISMPEGSETARVTARPSSTRGSGLFHLPDFSVAPQTTAPLSSDVPKRSAW
jgi:hypothetical protein